MLNSYEFRVYSFLILPVIPIYIAVRVISSPSQFIRSVGRAKKRTSHINERVGWSKRINPVRDALIFGMAWEIRSQPRT